MDEFDHEWTGSIYGLMNYFVNPSLEEGDVGLMWWLRLRG